MRTGNPSIGRLVMRCTGATVAVLLLGSYPTWYWAGEAGLWSALVAGGIALAVLVGSGWLVGAIARRKGVVVAGQVFLGSGLARFGLSLGLVFAARAALNLPIRPLLVWVGITYGVLLGVEAWWLARALARAGPREDVHEVCSNEHPG